MYVKFYFQFWRGGEKKFHQSIDTNMHILFFVFLPKKALKVTFHTFKSRKCFLNLKTWLLFGTWKGRKESQDALSNNLWRLIPFSTRSALSLSDHQKKRLLYPILFVIAQHWYLKLFQYSILRLILPCFLDDFLWLLMSFRFLNHYLFFLCDFCWFFTFLFPDLWAPRPRGYFPQKNPSKTRGITSPSAL